MKILMGGSLTALGALIVLYVISIAGGTTGNTASADHNRDRICQILPWLCSITPVLPATPTPVLPTTPTPSPIPTPVTPEPGGGRDAVLAYDVVVPPETDRFDLGIVDPIACPLAVIYLSTALSEANNSAPGIIGFYVMPEGNPGAEQTISNHLVALTEVGAWKTWIYPGGTGGGLISSNLWPVPRTVVRVENKNLVSPMRFILEVHCAPALPN